MKKILLSILALTLLIGGFSMRVSERPDPEFDGIRSEYFKRSIKVTLGILDTFKTTQAQAQSPGVRLLLLAGKSSTNCQGIPAGFPIGYDLSSGCIRGPPISISTTRTTTNGTATAPDSVGNYTQFANNVPRVTTGMGLWSEDGRTNSIRNPIMLGAIPGADNVEKLTNPTFTPAGGAGWTAGVSGGAVDFTIAGRARITGNGSNYNNNVAQQITGLTSGRSYVVAVGNASAGLRIFVGTAQGDGTYLTLDVAGNGSNSASPDRGSFIAPAGGTVWVTVGRFAASQGDLFGVSVQDGERVENGGFTSNPINASQNTIQNGWQWRLTPGAGTATVAYSSPNVQLHGDNTNAGQITQAIPTVSGLIYTISADIGGQSVAVFVATTPFNGGTLTGSLVVGTAQKIQFTASASTMYVTFSQQVAGTTSTVTNVSVVSAGQAPNGWTGFGATNGLIISVNAVGTTNGVLNYIDVNLSGTPTATSSSRFFIFGANNDTAATYGQTWTGSPFLSANNLTNITINQELREFAVDGTTTTVTNNGPNLALTPTLTRYPYSVTLTGATTAFLRTALSIAYTSGLAVNSTIRIAVPQTENNGSINSALASAVVAAGGSGGTPDGAVLLTVTGGTCTTQPTINGTITGGVLTAVGAVGTAGSCTVFPPSPATVTGNSLSGATLTLTPTNNAAQAFATTPILSNGSAAGVRGAESNLWASPPAIGPAVSGFARASAWNVPAANASSIGNFIDITSGVVTERILFASRNAFSQTGISSTAGGVGNTSIAVTSPVNQQNATPSVAFSFAQGTNTQAVSLNGSTPLTANVTTFPAGLSTPTIGIGNRFSSGSQNCNCAIAVFGLNPTTAVPSATLMAATTVQPDIDIDFLTGQYRGVTGPPSSFLTTARTAVNGSAYIYDAAGNFSQIGPNLPRVSDLGYLGEPQRANVMLRAQEFDNASWTKTDMSVTANATTAPDGTLTADLITEGVAGTANVAQISTATSASVPVSGQVFINPSANNNGVVAIVADGTTATGINTWVNISTCTAGSTQARGTATGLTLSATLVANGFCWLKATSTFDAAVTQAQIIVRSATADLSTTRVNNAAYYLWQGGVEVGDTASSPILTTTVAVTRSGDNTRLTVSPPFGLAYSMAVAWTPQGPINAAVNQNALQFDDGTDTQRTIMRRQLTAGRVLFAAVGGTGWSTSPATVFNPNVLTKWSARVAPSDQRPSLDGVFGSATTTAALPTTPNIVHIGVNANNSEQANGFIRRVQIWSNTGIPDNQLQVSPP